MYYSIGLVNNAFHVRNDEISRDFQIILGISIRNRSAKSYKNFHSLFKVYFQHIVSMIATLYLYMSY